MPVRGGWFIKNHIFIVQFRGRVTDDEYAKAAAHPYVQTVYDQTKSPYVHFVMEGVGEGFTSPSIRALANSGDLAKHPKYGWSVFINMYQNPALRMIIGLSSQLLKTKTRFVSTYPEAITFLRMMDPAIPEDAEVKLEWFNFVNWERDVPTHE